MTQPPEELATLRALANDLRSRRECILERWESLVNADGRLDVPGSVSQTQFRDHIPAILDEYFACLEGGAALPQEGCANGAAHGAERWQQGYDLKQLMREWSHLNIALLEEIERHAACHPQAHPDAMRKARRALAVLVGEGVNQSAEQHSNMREIEAESQLRELEQMLNRMRKMQHEHSEVVRGAAHDLRGNLGIVSNGATLLVRDTVPPPQRRRVADSLTNAITAQESLLNQLLELSRLQAGQERAGHAPFDAAGLLQELGAAMRPLAQARGLFLDISGPERLSVAGDALKVRRIAQNLILNAIQYTKAGGVTVRYEEDEEPTRDRCWTLLVEDTGPGLSPGPSGPMASALKEITQLSSASAEEQQHLDERIREGASKQRPGEGIGLSIVKRLCDLLGARIELNSSADAGTRFRIVFPCA